jgi:hypothetical protein
MLPSITIPSLGINEDLRSAPESGMQVVDSEALRRTEEERACHS